MMSTTHSTSQDRVEHTLEPIYSESSITLILGSMPSAKSRELKKYYGHISNRFWPIMASLYGQITDWKKFITDNNLALWDVIASCDISASSDSSIKNVSPNDIPALIQKTNIKNIVILGNTAYNLYNKFFRSSIPIEPILLPSPSSANASWSLERLIEKYRIIKEITK